MSLESFDVASYLAVEAPGALIGTKEARKFPEKFLQSWACRFIRSHAMSAGMTRCPQRPQRYGLQPHSPQGPLRHHDFPRV